MSHPAAATHNMGIGYIPTRLPKGSGLNSRPTSTDEILPKVRLCGYPETSRFFLTARRGHAIKGTIQFRNGIQQSIKP